jgi:hypothetical protein
MISVKQFFIVVVLTAGLAQPYAFAVQAGQSTTLKFLIQNFDEGGKFYLLAVDSRGSIIPIHPADVEIAAGGSVVVNVAVAIPRETAPGTGVNVTITVASTADPEIHNGTSVELPVVGPWVQYGRLFHGGSTRIIAARTSATSLPENAARPVNISNSTEPKRSTSLQRAIRYGVQF